MNVCPACSAKVTQGATSCDACGASVAQPQTLLSHRLRVIPPGGGEARFLELPVGEFICGRAPEAALQLQDPCVSPRHAQFVVGASVWIIDLGSANGIFARVTAPTVIRAGDEIRIGRQALRLEGLPPSTPAKGGGRVWGSTPQGHRFRLVQLLEGGGTGEALALVDGDYLLGREEGAMSFPGDLAISSRHCILSVSGEQATLRDLGSANGTFLRLHGEHELRSGDQLLVGNEQLRYDAVPLG
ncbi:MAG: FHA domain-containing protein [Deltaproteobacteria bacterium]